MKTYFNSYRIMYFAIALAVVLGSYCIILRLVDSILMNYDVYSSSLRLGNNHYSLDEDISVRQAQLKQKEGLLEALKGRKSFYPNVFRDVGSHYRCELIQMETSESPKNKQTQYRVGFTGDIRAIMNLFHALETEYHVTIQKAGLVSNAVDGSSVKLVIWLRAGKNERR